MAAQAINNIANAGMSILFRLEAEGAVRFTFSTVRCEPGDSASDLGREIK